MSKKKVTKVTAVKGQNQKSGKKVTGVRPVKGQPSEKRPSEKRPSEKKARANSVDTVRNIVRIVREGQGQGKKVKSKLQPNPLQSNPGQQVPGSPTREVYDLPFIRARYESKAMELVSYRPRGSNMCTYQHPLGFVLHFFRTRGAPRIIMREKELLLMGTIQDFWKFQEEMGEQLADVEEQCWLEGLDGPDDQDGHEEQAREEMALAELAREELYREEQAREELALAELGREELAREEQAWGVPVEIQGEITRGKITRGESTRGERQTPQEAIQ